MQVIFFELKRRNTKSIQIVCGIVTKPKLYSIFQYEGDGSRAVRKMRYFLSMLLAWWHGKFEPYENDPNSSLIFIGGYQKRHWTSNVAHFLVDFYFKYWQWIWTTGIAIIGLWLAILALK